MHQNQHGQVKTKVTKNIDKLKKSQEIGYVDVIRKGVFGSMEDIKKINLPKKSVPLKESKRVVDLLMDAM